MLYTLPSTLSSYSLLKLYINPVTSSCTGIPAGLAKIVIFLKKSKIGFFLFKSDFFYLNQIMIYIRIFHFLLGYYSYNCHNYVNNLVKQVCNSSLTLNFNCLLKSNKRLKFKKCFSFAVRLSLIVIAYATSC